MMQSQTDKRMEMLCESAYERLLVASTETGKMQSLQKIGTYRRTTTQQPK
jgi:hypothetical protein